MATPDDITSLFSDDRAVEREAANQEARRLEEDFALNHAVEAYNDPVPPGEHLVGQDAAWQKLEDHLQENRHLLNDLPEWKANYAEIDEKAQLKKDLEAFKHIRPPGDERDQGYGH